MDKKIESKAIELRHDIHRNPELSCEETGTMNRIQAFLERESDFEVVRRDGWLYAVHKPQGASKQGAPIALRADMDALPMDECIELPYASVNPGVSHKCGHDGHSAALAAAAAAVRGKEPNREIYLIFQPGEEIGAGGARCAELIREKGIASVYALHNWSGFPEDAIIVKKGCCQCASKGFTVRFNGTPAHASQPEDGLNPAEAIADVIKGVNSLAGPDMWQEAGIFEAMTLATVVECHLGEKNFGIAAHEGEVSWTLRAERSKDLELLEKKVKELAEWAAGKVTTEAAAKGAEGIMKVEYSECDVFPDTSSDDLQVEKVKLVAQMLGLQILEMEEPFRGSEDFGYYLKKCPGAIFYIGNGEDYAHIHTNEYDFRDENLRIAVDMWVKLMELG